MSRLTYLTENWAWSLALLILASTILFTIKFINHRRFYANLPTPNHSFVLGSLKVMGDAKKRFPKDCHPQSLLAQIAIDHDIEDICYLDLFPFAEPMIIITDPTLALQIQSSPPRYPRHPLIAKATGGLIGTKSVFSTVGDEWHRQRAWFAPAFSMTHLMTLVPGMVEECLVFKDNLTKYALSGKVCKVEHGTTRLAMDIICRSVGGLQLNTQTQDHPILDAFLAAIGWTAIMTEPLWKRAMSPFMLKLHLKKLDTLLGDFLKASFKNKAEGSADKSILDLAMKGYLKGNESLADSKGIRMDLNEEFMRVALDNTKVFILAGHDTTATMMSYMFYYLSVTPSILARVREEHNNVLGSTLAATLANIQEKPQLLNALPLTQAVLKEVLRLHPIGFGLFTAANKGETLTHNGREYPMDNHMIVLATIAFQHSPRFFNNPLAFDPDRFMDAETNASPAWQPFLRGKRDCIGQQMALLEGRILAVVTLRWFDFENAYEDTAESLSGWGGKAYQVIKMTASPKDGMPMRVKLRES